VIVLRSSASLVVTSYRAQHSNMARQKDKLKSKSEGAKGSVDSASSDEEAINDEGVVTPEEPIEQTEDDGLDESSKLEQFETKMKEAIDLATQKAAAGRVKALESINAGFLKHYNPDFVENQKLTICDLVDKSLKKGKGAEVEVAARLSILLALQLPDSEEVYKELRVLMVQIVTDEAANPAARTALATSLGGLCFLGGGEISEVASTMSILEGIFSASFSKPEWSLPAFPPEIQALHYSCLSAWSLLLTLHSSAEVHRMADSTISNLEGLLLSNDVDIRIAAGEAISLVLEFAYDHDEDYEPEGLDTLIDTIKELATDSNKSRSKKDRKEQRHIFRDILKGVEEGDPPTEKIKFGQETLLLDYWYKKTQYDWFSKVLASGTNHHLSSNYMLREVFELGAPLPVFATPVGSRMTKTQRHAANALAFKARTQSRGKKRDKRMVV